MDLQQAFNVLEHKFEDGVGTVVGTGIRREEWLPIRAALVEALKPSHNSRYMTALGVYEEYLLSEDYFFGEGFRLWLKERLNASEQPDAVTPCKQYDIDICTARTNGSCTLPKCSRRAAEGTAQVTTAAATPCRHDRLSLMYDGDYMCIECEKVFEF